MRILLAATIMALGFASAPVAAQPSTVEGQWANPKRSMVVSVSGCGSDDYCAVVVKASDKAQANARKGGTLHFIGTEILKVHPVGQGTFKGTAFDPETNMNVSATVRVVGPASMDIKGCAFLGLICDEQRWTKIN
jgi:uncharacterized protein (DUF2147 family)